MNGHLYFIGITGHAMRGLALAAREYGYNVSGLDEPAIPPGSDWVDKHKITWTRDFFPSQLDGVTKVIVTGAHVSESYPPIIEARRLGIPVQSYAEFFGELIKNEHVIAVAGTHGKTTTTSLITWILESVGRNPDYLIGIRPFNFDSSVRFEGSRVAVVEGDEYRASALEKKSKVQYYHPDTLVLTSVEHDHPDMFPDLASVISRFEEVVAAVPKRCLLVANAESHTVLAVAKSASCGITTYGVAVGDYTARDIAYLEAGLEFDIENHGGILGRIAVPLFGKHNVSNTLAAVATLLGEGLTIEEIISGAATFLGAFRRFNVLTPFESSVTVIDDYAHHPTEVATTLEAAKLHFAGRRVVAVFRPHTYSRTAALLDEYRRSFDSADLVYVTSIEGAREAGIAHKVSGEDITRELKMPALYTPARADLIKAIKADSRPGDVVVCMTVNGYENLAEELASELTAGVS